MCDVFKVAKVFCEKRNWSATNLEIQKLLYIAQVFSLGLRNKLLFKNTIQAWKYGPVIPDVYYRLRSCGSMPILPIMFGENSDEGCSGEEFEFVSSIAEATKNLRDWQLVGLTHRNGTAWQKKFDPNEFGTQITEQDMREEFNSVWKTKNA